MARVPFPNVPVWILRYCLQEKMIMQKEWNNNEKGREVRKEKKREKKSEKICRN